MWIHVSQNFTVEVVTSEMFEAASGKGCNKVRNLGVLQNELMKELKGKKFLLVLDDFWQMDVTMLDTLLALRNIEYPILPVMSELSTVRCDRAFGLWIAGTRASTVDGELPWWSSGRAAAVASTPGSRAQAATEGGFLGLRHKTKQADGC